MIDQATAADVRALVALKDDCIADMRAQGIEQWDEIYPAESNIASDIVAGTLHVLRNGAEIIGCVTVD